MKKREARILKAYIREHIKIVVIYAFIVVVLLGIAGIYDYEREIRNMSYAVVLILFFGAVYGVWNYICYRKKCILLLYALEKDGEYFQYIPESASYIEGLYQNMLSASEIRERRIISEFDEKKQDMADYYTMWTHQIKTPIAALRLLLQEDRQSLEEFSAHAVTDEKWLAFVIEQILSNALKYTPNGRIRIYGLDKQGRETDKEASFVVIEDSGIGIRKEDLPRIFERGFTGYNGRLDRKSTGIGLYLCKQIFDRLAHTIRVESKTGEGTKVILGFIQETM